MPIITLANAKILLQITGSDSDALINKLIPDVQSFIISKTNNFFEVGDNYNPNLDYQFPTPPISGPYDPYKVVLMSNTISFNASAKTILDSDSNFVNAGFKANMDIRVQYSVGNDGIFGISTVAAGVITLDSSSVIFDEDNSTYVRLAWVKFPQDLEDVAADLIRIGLTRNDSEEAESERVGNTNFKYVAGQKALDKIIRKLKPHIKANFV